MSRVNAEKAGVLRFRRKIRPYDANSMNYLERRRENIYKVPTVGHVATFPVCVECGKSLLAGHASFLSSSN